MRKYSRAIRKQKVPYLKDMLVNKNQLPIEIGEYTYGQPAIFADYWPCKVKIGKFCSIAPGVQILVDTEHRSDWVTTYPFPVLPDFPEALAIKGHPCAKGDVVIGNDVWIGKEAMILSGVTIGDGAVIGARAVVTKDVPPYCIAAGNPAQVIKKRFSSDIIAALLQLQWWDWPLEKIKKFIPLLCSRNVEELLDLAAEEGEQGGRKDE